MTQLVDSKTTPEQKELEHKLATLAALEAQLVQRELDLATLRASLESFEQRYIQIVGARLARLDDLDAQIAALIHLLNPHDDAAAQCATEARARADDSAQAGADYSSDTDQSPQPFKPDDHLKSLFRHIAKKVHPDLGGDTDDRARRTKIMAEANIAYQAGDTAKLEALLAQWEQSPEKINGDDIGSRLIRTIRQISQVETRIEVVNSELQQLELSELFVLFRKADDAAGEGIDLLTLMAAEIDLKIHRKQIQLDAVLDEYVQEEARQMSDEDQSSLIQRRLESLSIQRNKLVRRGIQASEDILAVPHERSLSHFESPALQLRGHLTDSRLIDEGYICSYGYGYVRQVYPVDDQYVVVITLATAGLYHWVTGEAKWVIDCLNWDAKLSPRHTYLAMSDNYNAGTALWDLRSGHQTVIPSDFGVRGIGFDRSETRLAIASGKGVLIYDLERRRGQGRIQTGSHTCLGVCFSPNGRILAVSTSKGDVQLWETDSLSLLGEIATPGLGLPDIAFSDDGEFLAGGNADTFYAWRVQFDGRSLVPWIVESYGEGVYSTPSNVVISLDNKCLLTWEGDLPLRMWDLDSRKLVSLSTSAPALKLANMLYVRNGQLFIAGTDGAKVYLWNSTTGSLVYRLELSGHHRSVTALQMTPDERYLLSGDKNGSVICWDLTQDGNSRQLWDTTSSIAAMQLISDQGQLVVVSHDGGVDIVNTVSGSQVCHGQVDISIEPNSRYEISTNGRTLAVVRQEGGAGS